MLDSVINLRLLSQPINWAIVLAILALTSTLWMLIAEQAGGGCNCQRKPS
jgi:hypothetical protein